MPSDSSWESSKEWYADIVGEKGHYYHQSVIFPNLFRLLNLKEGDALLDIGCGQGVLARQLPKTVRYVGLDVSKSLIQEAKKKNKKEDLFFVADAEKPFPFDMSDFSAAVFLLSLQNMEHPEKALQSTASRLKEGGKLLLVLNHPCFRIPRHSSWQVDEKMKLQYRRVNTYLSPLKIPIQTHPGKGGTSPTTYSFHYPLSTLSKWIQEAGCTIALIEELCSDKKSEGKKAKMEDRARREFPLFLAILCQKNRGQYNL